MSDDYLIDAVNKMTRAIMEGNDRRKLRYSNWNEYFSAACEGLSRLLEDKPRIEIFAEAIRNPFLPDFDLTRDFLREFKIRDQSLMRAAGLSRRAAQELFRHAEQLDFYIMDERPQISLELLTDLIKTMQIEICSRAIPQNHLLNKAVAVTEVMGGGAIVTVNTAASAKFFPAALSCTYGGNLFLEGMERFRRE